jgi:hypothetical protein
MQDGLQLHYESKGYNVIGYNFKSQNEREERLKVLFDTINCNDGVIYNNSESRLLLHKLNEKGYISEYIEVPLAI